MTTNLMLIKHRVNRIGELAAVHPDWGVELDVRRRGGKTPGLHVVHDPWEEGDELGAWLAACKARGIAGPLIINTKEDGLEGECQALLASHGLTRYFFLDTQIPTLVRLSVQGGDSRFAVRYSAFEPVELAERFRGAAAWVWVDCFGGEPPSVQDVERLKRAFKVCLVSPELQVGVQADLAAHVLRFRPLKALADAVCTKVPEFWR